MGNKLGPRGLGGAAAVIGRAEGKLAGCRRPRMVAVGVERIRRHLEGRTPRAGCRLVRGERGRARVKRSPGFRHEIQENGGATVRGRVRARSRFPVGGRELSFRHAEFGAWGVSGPQECANRLCPNNRETRTPSSGLGWGTPCPLGSAGQTRRTAQSRGPGEVQGRQREFQNRRRG